MAAWFSAGHSYELISDRPEGRVKIATLSFDERWCVYLWTIDKLFYETSLNRHMVSNAKRWAVGRISLAFEEAIAEMSDFKQELVNG